MHIQILLPKEKETQNQNKNSLHMAQNLERNCSKSANADELAKIGPNGNTAWQE